MHTMKTDSLSTTFQYCCVSLNHTVKRYKLVACKEYVVKSSQAGIYSSASITQNDELADSPESETSPSS